MAKWLTDERLALIAKSNPNETTEGWIRQAITLVWARRDLATDLSAEEAGFLGSLDYLLTCAAVTDARTLKVVPITLDAQMLDYQGYTGPKLVPDAMATIDDGDPDGA